MKYLSRITGLALAASLISPVIQAQVVGPYNGITHLSSITGPCNATTLSVLGDADFSTNGTYEIPYGTTFSGTWATGLGYTDGPGPEMLCVSLHTLEAWDVRLRLSDGSFTAWLPVTMSTILDSVIWTIYDCGTGSPNPNWDYDRRVELVDFASYTIPVGLTVVGAEFTLTVDNAGAPDPVGILLLGGSSDTLTASNNGPLCSGDTLMLFGPDAPGATYSWSGPGGFSSVQQSPVIPHSTTQDAGIYTVLVTDSAGTDTLTTTVVIHSTPAGSIQSTSGCGNAPVSFSFTNTSSATIDDYTWNFGTGNPADTSDIAAPVFTFPGAGNYTVTLTLTSPDGCIGTVDTVVGIGPTPTADFITAPLCFQQIVFTSTSVNEPSLNMWEWVLPDTTIMQMDSSQSFIYTFTDTGAVLITLVVTDSLGCTDTVTHPITIFQSAGLATMPNLLNTSSTVGNNKYDFAVFSPQFIQCYDYTFTVYNRWGYQVFQTSSKASNPDLTCASCFQGYDSNGAKLVAGVYYYVLEAIPEFKTKGTITIFE